MIYEFDEAEEVFVPKSAFGMSAERVEALRERRIKLATSNHPPALTAALLAAEVSMPDFKIYQDLPDLI